MPALEKSFHTEVNFGCDRKETPFGIIENRKPLQILPILSDKIFNTATDFSVIVDVCGLRAPTNVVQSNIEVLDQAALGNLDLPVDESVSDRSGLAKVFESVVVHAV